MIVKRTILRFLNIHLYNISLQNFLSSLLFRQKVKQLLLFQVKKTQKYGNNQIELSFKDKDKQNKCKIKIFRQYI